MKVVQINTTVNSGSTGRIAEDIGNVILAHGHESYIAFGRGNQPSRSSKLRIGNDWSVRKHALKTLLLDRHGFASGRATEDLLKQLDKIQPDVIGLHNIHGYYLHVGHLFKYIHQKKLPVVWTLHDCWSFTGHCTYYDSIGCIRWKTGCYQCPKKHFYPASYGLDSSKQNYQDKKHLFNLPEKMQLITPSHWLADQVKSSFLNKYSVRVIHNGIDLNVFKPADESRMMKLKTSFQLEGKSVVLGVASIWDPRKGLSDFLSLRNLLPSNVAIVLIGLNQKQISALPVGITGVSRTENVQELSAWYSLADVFLNPTYQDNFPTTNIEALACGTPVITYNTGGSPEAVDSHTGMVLDKGDVKGLQVAIEKIVATGKEYFQPLCRQRAEKMFNKNDRFHDYLEVYQSLIKEPVVN